MTPEDRDLLGRWTEILPDDDDTPDAVSDQQGLGLVLLVAGAVVLAVVLPFVVKGLG